MVSVVEDWGELSAVERTRSRAAYKDSMSSRKVWV